MYNQNLFFGIINFCEYNRKNKAFKDFSIVEIAQEIITSLKNNSLVVDISSEGNILGVLTFTTVDKELFINQIITVDKGSIKRMLVEFKTRYPDYNICAMRNRKFKQYNTNRLVHLLNTI